MGSLKIKLQLTPSPSNCLAWSEDGLLAIAGLEYVLIMIPKRPQASDDSAIPQWRRTKIKINDFTEEEWPSRRPHAAKTMAIGEEQADTTAVALAWSPAGLAVYRRPALAVLTANHVLSLWASSSNIEESGTWRRVFVINDFNSGAYRIRSMGWAPSQPTILNGTSWQQRQGRFFIAIGLDDNQVQFLEISSPSTTDAGKWQSTILVDVDLNRSASSKNPNELGDEELPRRDGRFSLFRSAMMSFRYIEGIEFGAWKEHDGHSEILVQFRSCNTTSHLCLSQVNDDTMRYKVQVLDDNTDRLKIDLFPSQIQQYQASENSRVMGLARFGQILAVCVITPPRHQVSYRGPSEDICTIIFKFDDGPPIFPWQEPVHVDMKALKTVVSRIIDPDFRRSLAANAISLKILYAIMMTFILIFDMKSEVLYAQAQSLLSTLELFSGELKDEREFLFNLAHEILPDGNTQVNRFERAIQINWERAQHYQDNFVQGGSPNSLLENCPVCTSKTPLGYQNLWVASCRTGHQFDRCKISLLPILDLTWQKTCSDCGLQFVDETKHPGMRDRSTSDRNKVLGKDTNFSNGDDATSAPDETHWAYLANYVFVEFDRCPYCKGNFTG